MKSLRLAIACLSGLMFFPFAMLHGQQPSHFNLNLQKNIVSWVWDADFRSHFKTGREAGITVSNQFRSSLFQQSSLRNNWRDENNFNIHYQQPLSKRFSTQSELSSGFFSDDNVSREFSKSFLAQSLKIEAHPKVILTPSLGWARETAFDFNDQGWYSKNHLKINRLDMGGYLNSSEASGLIRAFPGRTNQEYRAVTGWTKQFSEFASDSLRLGFEYSENRNYVAASTNTGLSSTIEETVIDERFVENLLSYRFSPRATLLLITNFKNRVFDQRSPRAINSGNPNDLADERFDLRTRSEQALSNRVDHIWQFGRLQFQNSILFSQTTKDNDGIDTDVSALQAAFNHSLILSGNHGNRIWGKFSYTKFEYNTPESSDLADRNLQADRDELRFIIDSGIRRRFSPYLTMTLRGNVYLFHQIYIRSGRSRNNNWNRIFLLSAAFKHKISSRLENRQQVRVLANYTAFDFDNILPQARSFVFRKFVISDSLSYRLTNSLSLNGIYELEREDNGTFFPESFTQRLTKELTAHNINLFVNHNSVWGVEFSGGINIYLRNEWGYNPAGERRRTRRFRSVTPRLVLRYPASNRLILYASYSPTQTRNRQRSVSSPSADFRETRQFFTNGKINLRYLF